VNPEQAQEKRQSKAATFAYLFVHDDDDDAFEQSGWWIDATLEYADHTDASIGTSLHRYLR
jgi:hypothetical protein